MPKITPIILEGLARGVPLISTHLFDKSCTTSPKIAKSMKCKGKISFLQYTNEIKHFKMK